MCSSHPPRLIAKNSKWKLTGRQNNATNKRQSANQEDDGQVSTRCQTGMGYLKIEILKRKIARQEYLSPASTKSQLPFEIRTEEKLKSKAGMCFRISCLKKRTQVPFRARRKLEMGNSKLALGGFQPLLASLHLVQLLLPKWSQKRKCGTKPECLLESRDAN